MRTMEHLRIRSKEVPVFFACDDGYVDYMTVCMRSLIANTSLQNEYRLYVLHTDISEQHKEQIRHLERQNVTIEFVDVSTPLSRIEKKLSLRDYYSNTTYYRIFIPNLFPEYDKVIYIDSDTIVLKDIALLYHYQLGDNYIGAIRDQLVLHEDIFGDYTEKVLGISREAYFNAGVVLLNCHQFRKRNLLKEFIDLINTYSFVVAQDQDYLNTICKEHVRWLDGRWNAQTSRKVLYADDQIALLHYNLASKPWNYEDIPYAEYFWKYAKQTECYDRLRERLSKVNEENLKKDLSSGRNLLHLATEEIANEHNYYRVFGNPDSPSTYRMEVLNRIRQLEREGRFDVDAEDDPPGRELLPNEVDYLKRSFKSKTQAKYAFRIARWYLNTMLRKRQIIIRKIIGIENYRKLESGAIITCNHFHPMDSFAMHIAYDRSGQRRRKLFRVIKEGNYTSFPGLYGFLMRNCNTLPLSSNKDTMKKFLKATDKILQSGHFILIYPEQSMWWNYRKPKPLKKGGFTMAAKNHVPVLPIFITMEDSDVTDGDGFPVQEYTIHIAKPIYPDPKKKQGENVEEMMAENARIWKAIYEETYGIPLLYETEEDA